MLTLGGGKGGSPSSSRAPLLPTELMRYPSCRTMQLDLLGLSDLLFTSSQLALFAGSSASGAGSGAAGLLSLVMTCASGLPAPPVAPALATALHAAAGALCDSGCRSVAEAAPLQLLAWLGGASWERDGSSSEQQAARVASMAHEAWFAWQQALWRGAAQRLPSAHAAAVLPSAAAGWAALSGPARLHVAALTVLASGLAAGSEAAAISERAPRLLQLRLAAAALRQRCVSEAAGEPAVSAAEWQAARLVAAALLAAHLPSVAEGAPRRQLQKVIDALAQQAAAFATQRPSELLDALASAVSTSNHATLRALLQPLLLPAVRELLGSGSGGAAACGRAWALLGLARLHLLVPPAGVDPAAKYAMVRGQKALRLGLQLEPELAVRRAFAALPGGADESARIAELEATRAALLREMDGLEVRATPRPNPPQYLAARDDVARFVASFGDLDRVVAMAFALASTDVGARAAAAAAAAVWQENAAAWVERLGRQYSGYWDVLQPVQLAVQELRYGLALLQGAAALAAVPTAAPLAPVIATLMAFPRAAAEGWAAALDAPAVQQAAATAASDAVLRRAGVGHTVASEGGDASLDLRRVAEGAAAAARLRLLRVALHIAAADLAAGRLSAGPETAPHVANDQLRLHSVFAGAAGSDCTAAHEGGRR